MAMSKTVCYAGRKAYAALLACGLVSVCWAVDIPDPVIWWDMEAVSNGKIADKSGNGHDLTIGPGASLTNGYYGVNRNTLFFNGTKSAYASFSAPAFSGSRTVSFWTCREPTGGPWRDENSSNNLYPYIFFWRPIRFHFYNDGSNGNHNMAVYDPNGVRYFTAISLYGRKLWSHVTLTFEVTEQEGNVSHVKFKSYVNGLLQTAPDTVHCVTNFATTAGPSTLGNNGTNSDRPVFGAIGEVRLWNSALTREQVAADYERSLEGHGAQLLGRWTFDDTETNGSGQLVIKEATGLSSSITCGPGMTLSGDGVEGNAIVCDGTTNTWGTSGVKSYPLGDYTWALWFKQSLESPFDTTSKVGEENRGPRIILYSNGNFHLNAQPGVTQGNIYTHGGGTGAVDGQWNIPLGKTPGEWNHLAVATRFTVETNVYQDIYLNGEYAYTTTEMPALAFVRSSTGLLFANLDNHKRPFEGMVDDLRFYAGTIPSNTVRRLYRGAATVDAGADFSVASDKATLRGSIGNSAPQGFRKGYAGTPRWTLVSAPAGGEGATILQPGSPVTSVTLPAEGVYVFRLSNVLEDVGLERHDEVTVTRVAAAGAAPTVTLASATASGVESVPVELAATVTDGARVSWSKVSGPGGAWFEPANAATTQARFSEAGTYVVRCTAEKTGASATGDMTVTVSAFTRATTLSNGLIRWWPMSQDNPFCERVIGTAYATSIQNHATRLADGPNGYSFRPDGYQGYFKVNTDIGEVNASGVAKENDPPAEQWRAVSAWIYHDSTDTNTFKSAAIFAVPYTLGIWYDFNTSDGTANQLRTYQQGAGGGAVYRSATFPYDPTNRWMHVYALFDRTGGSAFEIWIDGVQRTLSGTGTWVGRIKPTTYIGGWPANLDSTLGNSNGYLKHNTTGVGMSRCFPGKIADVRVYNRKLTAQEIQTLARTFGTENFAPAIDGFASDKMTVATKKSKAVATAVFDDGEPAGGTLTYKWSVLSGNAAAASFGDATARETTFTATAVGTYVLQLAVSDGERTSYSAPLTVEVVAAGTIVVIK